MHAHRETARACIDIIPDERALAGFVPAAGALQSQGQGRDHLSLAQMRAEWK
jgi:hypothetical protein